MSLEAKSKAKATAETGFWDLTKILVEAIVIAFLLRIFLYQPFTIPTGSMERTLLVGDFLFVSKLSYGYSRYSFPYGVNLFSGRIFAGTPERGDVVVFKLPSDNSTDYIKRVIGLPGDEIRVQDGVVYINGTAVPRRFTGDVATYPGEGYSPKIPSYEETLPNGKKYTVLDADPHGSYDDAGPYNVPEGHYFMMGDNRDNSYDSRARDKVGFVPYENLVGRADIVMFSKRDYGHWTMPWSWPFDIRWSRFFTLVH
jgi:signal peptidase I